MKRFVIGLAATLLGTGLLAGMVLAAGAEAGGAKVGPGARARARVGHVLRQLNLTDDQKAKVKDILVAARADAAKAADRPAKVAVFKAAFAKIKSDVLTDDQRKQLEQMKGKFAARVRARVRARVGHVLRQLNLTDDQKAKIKDILVAARADAAKAADRPAKVAVFKAAFTKIKSDVLTDDQRKQLEQMKAKAGRSRLAPAGAAGKTL